MRYYKRKSFSCLKLPLVVMLLILEKVSSESIKMDADLFASPEEKKDVIVSFGSVQEMKGIVDQLTSNYKYAPKEDRIYAMYQAMYSYSAKCKSSAQSYLNNASYTYHDMWSSNILVIRDADHACATKLAEMSDVTTIKKDTTFPLIDPVMHLDREILVDSATPDTFTIGTSWGLAVMRVPEAWKYAPTQYGYGYGTLRTGKGITVSNIDTGVNWNHITLQDNFRKKAGWMDGYNLTDTPEDLNGHGTHTMGTICGQSGIGVAPGAKWIACRGCFQHDCLESALLKCCQWILCPHDMNQAEPEDYRACSMAPDLVSNSWGGGQGEKSFERCALALRAAGIMPIWAIGNAGPNCTTANSPGDLEYVIGVGATDENDELCKFSSKGPTVEGKIKPDVSAPGMHIKSCWHNSTTSFFTISGTSMATPHVSGLVALMLERCRLPYTTVLNILQTTADRSNLGTTTQVCGGTKSDKFPNNFYGYGRVNALEAIKKVVQICHYNKNYHRINKPYHRAPYNGVGYNSNGNYNSMNSNSYAYPYWYGAPAHQRAQGYNYNSYGPYQTGYGYYRYY